MAENEMLDLGKSRRWQNLCRLIQAHASVEDIWAEAKDCLPKTLQNVAKQIPLSDMLMAAEEGNGNLGELVRNCQKAKDFARLLQVCAEQAANGGLNHGSIAESFIWAIFDKFYDQIRMESVSAECAHNFQTLDQLRAELKLKLAPTVQELARQLYRKTNDRTTPIRMPKTTTAQKAKHQEKLLEMSVL